MYLFVKHTPTLQHMLKYIQMHFLLYNPNFLDLCFVTRQILFTQGTLNILEWVALAVDVDQEQEQQQQVAGN